uniref:Uncharacterized protein n=1 Tax=Graphocephala atropunctata TaxID=36148 RepID=A0A1B6KAD3_9HEMI
MPIFSNQSSLIMNFKQRKVKILLNLNVTNACTSQGYWTSHSLFDQLKGVEEEEREDLVVEIETRDDVKLEGIQSREHQVALRVRTEIPLGCWNHIVLRLHKLNIIVYIVKPPRQKIRIYFKHLTTVNQIILSS